MKRVSSLLAPSSPILPKESKDFKPLLRPALAFLNYSHSQPLCTALDSDTQLKNHRKTRPERVKERQFNPSPKDSLLHNLPDTNTSPYLLLIPSFNKQH